MNELEKSETIETNVLLESYSQMVEQKAIDCENKVFYNNGDTHASIVLTNIVKYSKSEINMLSGNLCSPVSNSDIYVNVLRSFLQKDGIIKVLLCDCPDTNDFKNTAIYKLFSQFEKNVKIKVVKNSIKVDSDKPIHFTVADNRAYRLETDVIEKKAICNFNDSSFSAVLNKIFNKLFTETESKEIELKLIN